MLVTLAQDHPPVLIINELSAVAASEEANGLLRAKLQHHDRKFGLVVAGWLRRRLPA